MTHSSGARTRRGIRLAAVFTALALTAAACGGDDDTDAGDDTGTEDTAESADSSDDAEDTATEDTADSGDSADSSSDGDADAEPVELRWALSDTPDTLFAPTYFNSPIGSGLMGLVQDNLLVYTGEGELVPSLAEAWEATSPTTYRYTVREGVLFSDGTPVTPEDVKFSIDMQSDPAVASKQAALFENVSEVTIDGNDVVVELATPSSTWKFMPSHMGMYIYSKADVEANLESYGTPEHFPLGSGPYMVEEFVPDSHVTMVRNPNYWGEAPAFDTIRFDIIPDDQTRLLAMQSGDIDGTFNVPSAAISQWEQAATLVDIEAFIFRGFTLDMDQDPFSDLHVRRALYFATDRAGITEGLFPGQAVPATTLNTPSIYEGVLPVDEVEAGYAEMEDFSFDLDKAREELAMSSVPDGFSTVLNVPDGSEASILISQSIKDTWGQIGVDVELNLMPGGPRFQIILDHEPNLGVQIVGNLPDVPDPLQMLALYYKSDQAAKNGNNSSNFRSDEVDAMIDEALQSTDPVEAAQMGLEIQALAAEQVPIIPVLWSDFKFAIRDDWTFGPMNGFSVSHVFVEAIDPS